GRTSAAGGGSAPGEGSVAVGAEAVAGLGGDDRRLDAAFHAEFGQEAGDVVLDRLLGQVQTLADLPVGEPLTDQCEDLPLPFGQPRQRVRALLLLLLSAAQPR